MIRGFVRAALVDPDGTEHCSNWHENALTSLGVQNMMNCFATTGNAAGYIAVGNHTDATSNVYSKGAVGLQTEYVPNTSSGSARKAVGQSTSFSGASSQTGIISFTASFASSEITSNATVNAVGIFSHASTHTTGCYSIATFTSSTKGSTQALNITYTYNLATA
jgi:hypothetical protein